MFDFGIETISRSGKASPIGYWMIRFRDGQTAIASTYRASW